MARRRGKTGDLKQLRALMWEGMEQLAAFQERAREADDSQEYRALMHCLTQSAGVYHRIVEAGELEERVSALEVATR